MKQIWHIHYILSHHKHRNDSFLHVWGFKKTSQPLPFHMDRKGNFQISHECVYRNNFLGIIYKVFWVWLLKQGISCSTWVFLYSVIRLPWFESWLHALPALWSCTSCFSLCASISSYALRITIVPTSSGMCKN